MSTDNPFVAPTTAPAAPANLDVASGLAALDWPSLKRLRNASQNIRALGVLWMLGVVGMSVILVLNFNSPERNAATPSVLLVLLMALGVLGIVAVWRRPTWGRMVATIFCCLNLLSIPIGTIIGIIGLIALKRGAPLFGPGRWTHREVEARYRELKAQQR
jgi:hypothetical protein